MTAMSIVTKHGQNAWDVECIHELRCTLKVKMSDILALQPAIVMAIDSPSHCGIGLYNEEDSVKDNNSDDDIVAHVEDQRANANTGLTMYQHIPPGMKGHLLFEHQI